MRYQNQKVTNWGRGWLEIETTAGTIERLSDYNTTLLVAEAGETLPHIAAANESTIKSRAETALAANATFLAIASPTNAQTLAQVKALTRQMNGVVRLVLHRFDGTD